MLKQPPRHKRANHVSLNLGVWAKAFGRDLLGDRHDPTNTSFVLLRRQHTPEHGKLQQFDHPRHHSGSYDRGHTLFHCRDVPIHIRVSLPVPKRLTKG